MMLLGVVADAGVVHHWDGSLDGVASLWLSKEHVPADGSREIWEMGTVLLMMLLVVVDAGVVHHWDGSL